jgi:hypothetical protein
MIKTFKSVVIICVFLFISLISAIAQTETTSQLPTEKERVEAEKLWEQIIEAKGGRKKLHSVTNMVLTKGDKPDNLGVFFYVFPNKYWRWTQGPPSPKTIWVHMTNLDYGVYMVASNEGLVGNDKLSEEDHNLTLVEKLTHGCVYLLETKWLQPKPTRVERTKIDKEQLDVVETHLYDSTIGIDERLDFAVEPETLLVRWVVRYYNGKPLFYYYFDRYTTVEGIQMPLRYGDQRNFTEKKYFIPLKFELNVKYNEQLFEKPPTVEAGSGAWKPKPKTDRKTESIR